MTPRVAPANGNGEERPFARAAAGQIAFVGAPSARETAGFALNVPVEFVFADMQVIHAGLEISDGILDVHRAAHGVDFAVSWLAQRALTAGASYKDVLDKLLTACGRMPSALRSLYDGAWAGQCGTSIDSAQEFIDRVFEGVPRDQRAWMESGRSKIRVQRVIVCSAIYIAAGGDEVNRLLSLAEAAHAVGRLLAEADALSRSRFLDSFQHFVDAQSSSRARPGAA